MDAFSIENTRPWWWIAVSIGLSSIAVLLIWRFLPPKVERFYQRLDDLIPADFSDYKKPTTRILMTLLSGFVLAAAGFSIADTLGFETERPLTEIRDAGLLTLGWLGSRLLTIAGIVLVSLLIIRVFKVVVPRALESLIKSDPDVAGTADIIQRKNTLERVVISAISTLILVMAFFMTISELGVNITPLIAGAGIVGLAVAFGAQNMIRDLLAGVFIVLEDQYRVGDVVNVAGIGGVVEDFNLRRTVLRDLDLTVHSIPNGEIKATSNLTRIKARVNLNISVAYKEDIERCAAIINRVGQEMKDDPEWGQHMNEAIKFIRIDNFGDSSVDLKVLGETKPMKQWDVAGEFRMRIKKAFDRAGIEIPYPHRTIYWGDGAQLKISSNGKGLHEKEV